MADLDKELQRIEQGEAWEESDEVVQLDVKKPLDKVVPIRLQAADWAKLREEARGLGVGPTTLARMWILARLRLESDLFQELKLALDRLIIQHASKESWDAMISDERAIDEFTKSKESVETIKRRVEEIQQKWNLLRDHIAEGESKQKV